MKKQKINIDKEWLSKKCREWADSLEKDFWGNLYEVVHEMSFQVNVYSEKIKGMSRYLIAKYVEEYGRIQDIEDKKNEQGKK